MRCSVCTAATHVLDTRAGPDAVRRRRECTVCGLRVTTYERAMPVDAVERTVLAYVRSLDAATEETTTRG